jgi:hypothetical protein
METTPTKISAVLRIEDESRVGFWDALIVSSAAKSGATRNLSEGLIAGQGSPAFLLRIPLPVYSEAPSEQNTTPANIRIPIGRRLARPERFELPTLCFEDKSAASRKALPRNTLSENKTLSFLNGMCAAVSGYVHLTVGSLQKPLQCVGLYCLALYTPKPP